MHCCFAWLRVTMDQYICLALVFTVLISLVPGYHGTTCLPSSYACCLVTQVPTIVCDLVHAFHRHPWVGVLWPAARLWPLTYWILSRLYLLLWQRGSLKGHFPTWQGKSLLFVLEKWVLTLWTLFGFSNCLPRALWSGADELALACKSNVIWYCLPSFQVATF